MIALLQETFKEDTLHESMLRQWCRVFESVWELAELQLCGGKPKMVCTELHIDIVVVIRVLSKERHLTKAMFYVNNIDIKSLISKTVNAKKWMGSSTQSKFWREEGRAQKNWWLSIHVSPSWSIKLAYFLTKLKNDNRVNTG